MNTSRAYGPEIPFEFPPILYLNWITTRLLYLTLYTRPLPANYETHKGLYSYSRNASRGNTKPTGLEQPSY